MKFAIMNERETIDDYFSKFTTELNALEKADLKEKLILYINHLLLNDFNVLVQHLYRIDVNEEKLKELLRNHPDEDAAVLISGLIIERQEEKARTRQEFKDDETSYEW